MSNLRQAAQQALDELANAKDHIYLLPENAQALTEAEMLERLRTAITALRAALAEPEQKSVMWKLVPVEPTHEMLKAMDECSTEGYDERLLAGHAASVYMAAVDVAPLYTAPTPRKPLTDEEINRIVARHVRITDQNLSGAVYMAMRELEAAHRIGENNGQD